MSDQNLSSSSANQQSSNPEQVTSQVARTIELRRSVPLVSEPKATQQQITEAVRLALLAPDHRRLTPWRFVLVEGSEAFEKLAIAVGGGDSKFENKWRQKFARAPQILFALLSPVDSPKVPIEEQLMSLGAAIEHILLYLSEQGLGTIWRTGDICQSKGLKSLLDMSADQQIGGMIYIGTPVQPAKPKPALSVDDFLKAL